VKRTILTAKTIVLLLGLLASVGCGIIAQALVEAATRAATQRVVLVSFHGRYVTALGESGDWQIKQEPELGACGRFTQHHLANGKIALKTCYDRYVTAPQTGATRWDWLLGQESELGNCGQFTLHDLGRDEVAFETCAGRFVTAGDEGWPPGLQWSLVGETYDILAWERFTVLLEP